MPAFAGFPEGRKAGAPRARWRFPLGRARSATGWPPPVRPAAPHRRRRCPGTPHLPALRAVPAVPHGAARPHECPRSNYPCGRRAALRPVQGLGFFLVRNQRSHHRCVRGQRGAPLSPRASGRRHPAPSGIGVAALPGAAVGRAAEKGKKKSGENVALRAFERPGCRCPGPSGTPRPPPPPWPPSRPAAPPDPPRPDPPRRGAQP